jgi:hypothetical protein
MKVDTNNMIPSKFTRLSPVDVQRDVWLWVKAGKFVCGGPQILLKLYHPPQLFDTPEAARMAWEMHGERERFKVNERMGYGFSDPRGVFGKGPV